MSDFSFLALPNVEGMRLGWYVQIFCILALFGISLFFVIYFWRKYRSNKSLVAQLYHFDEQSQHISKQVLGQKIHKTSGKTKLILFIEYLEKFTTTTPYTDIRGLLSIQGFAHQDIQDLQRVLYADEKLSTNLEKKINERVVSNSKF